jgi:hypothetical protein
MPFPLPAAPGVPPAIVIRLRHHAVSWPSPFNAIVGDSFPLGEVFARALALATQGASH